MTNTTQTTTDFLQVIKDEFPRLTTPQLNIFKDVLFLTANLLSENPYKPTESDNSNIYDTQYDVTIDIVREFSILYGVKSDITQELLNDSDFGILIYRFTKHFSDTLTTGGVTIDGITG